jgi:hypothetical protein
MSLFPSHYPKLLKGEVLPGDILLCQISPEKGIKEMTFLPPRILKLLHNPPYNQQTPTTGGVGGT